MGKLTHKQAADILKDAGKNLVNIRLLTGKFSDQDLSEQFLKEVEKVNKTLEKLQSKLDESPSPSDKLNKELSDEISHITDKTDALISLAVELAVEQVGREQKANKADIKVLQKNASNIIEETKRNNRHYEKYADDEEKATFQITLEKKTYKLETAAKLLSKADDYPQTLDKYKTALLDVYILRRKIVKAQINQIPDAKVGNEYREELREKFTKIEDTPEDKKEYLSNHSERPATKFLKARNEKLSEIEAKVFQTNTQAHNNYGEGPSRPKAK